MMSESRETRNCKEKRKGKAPVMEDREKRKSKAPVMEEGQERSARYKRRRKELQHSEAIQPFVSVVNEETLKEIADKLEKNLERKMHESIVEAMGHLLHQHMEDLKAQQVTILHQTMEDLRASMFKMLKDAGKSTYLS